MKTNTSNKTNNILKNKENKTMKTTIKMILTVVLALSLVCALGAPAFADFMSPYGYVTVNYDGSRTLHLSDGSTVTQYPDGTLVSYDAATGETTYSDDRFSATTFYQDGSTFYQDGSTYYENGNGYSEYHDSFGYSMTE